MRGAAQPLDDGRAGRERRDDPDRERAPGGERAGGGARLVVERVDRLLDPPAGARADRAGVVEDARDRADSDAGERCDTRDCGQPPEPPPLEALPSKHRADALSTWPACSTSSSRTRAGRTPRRRRVEPGDPGPLPRAVRPRLADHRAAGAAGAARRGPRDAARARRAAGARATTRRPTRSRARSCTSTARGAEPRFAELGWPVRDGELRYYGSADSTPWFLVVLAALGDDALSRRARARAARRRRVARAGARRAAAGSSATGRGARPAGSPSRAGATRRAGRGAPQRRRHRARGRQRRRRRRWPTPTCRRSPTRRCARSRG